MVVACKCCERTFDTAQQLSLHCKQKGHAPPSVFELFECTLAHNSVERATTSHKPLARVVPVFDDEFVCVVRKPQGMETTGTASLQRCDELMFLRQHAANSTDALSKPHTVHRLDKETGGLVVLAKTKSAVAKLSQQFAEHAVLKRYRAVVWGKLEGTGIIDFAVDEKPSVTRFSAQTPRLLPDLGWVTVVDLFPQTGRRHQLRKHLSRKGFPIVGDTRYGGSTLAKVPSLRDFQPAVSHAAVRITATKTEPPSEDQRTTTRVVGAVLPIVATKTDALSSDDDTDTHGRDSKRRKLDVTNTNNVQNETVSLESLVVEIHEFGPHSMMLWCLEMTFDHPCLPNQQICVVLDELDAFRKFQATSKTDNETA